MKETDLKKRVYLIDELRGLSIILMVVYHTFYDLTDIFNLNIPAFNSYILYILVIIFAGSFIFISGTASHYSHNNLKRGITCFGFGMILTLFTFFFMKDELIVFGILHCLGICMMLFPLIRPVFDKISYKIGIPICLVLFLLTLHIPDGYIGLFNWFSLDLPTALYKTKFLFWIGLPNLSFYSTDYFPLIPWIFVFLAGGFFGKVLKENKLPEWVYKPHIKPLAFVGRHTFIIYLLHQPVVYGILVLIFNIIK